MRFIAPTAALALAGIAWVGCWQEIQLTALKRQVKNAAAVAAAEAPTPAPRRQLTTALARPPTRAVISQLDELRGLLVEREQAIADARDAAGEFGIADGSPDMDQAILLATQDLDRSIIKLAGPAAVGQLTLPPPPVAPIPPDVQVAPAPAVVVVPAQPAAPAGATNIYVNVAAPVYAAAADPEPAADPVAAGPAGMPIIYGGLGATFGTAISGQPKKVSALQQEKYFAASAGIPMSPSPLGVVATTSPLLLSRMRTASAATGR